MDNKVLLARAREAEAIRQRCTTDYGRIAKYVMPNSYRYDITFTGQGQFQTTPTQNESFDVHDTTARSACSVLAGGTLNYVAPVNRRWFKLESQDGNNKEFLDEASDTMFKGLAASNFYQVFHEALVERSAFGVGAYTFVGLDNSGLPTFEAVPPGSFAFEEDVNGLPGAFYRSVHLTVAQVAEAFPDYKPQGKAADVKRLLHIVIKRTWVDEAPAEEANPFLSFWFLDDKLINKGSFRKMPYFVSRFMGSAQNIYGWGPAHSCLPDIEALNELEHVLDVAVSKMVEPPILAPYQESFTASSRPGEITYYDPLAGGAKPEVWQVPTQYSMGVDRAEKKRQRIASAFMLDVFNLFSSQTRQLTAAEVAELSNERLAQFSPTFVRLVNEGCLPMLDAYFDKLLWSKYAFKSKLPPADSLKYSVALYSSGALSHKGVDALNIQRLVNASAGYVQLNPQSVVDVLDFDSITRRLADDLGVVPEVVNSSTKTKTLRDERAKQQQAAQAAQAAEMLLKGQPAGR